jgi:hypothetical protein
MRRRSGDSLVESCNALELGLGELQLGGREILAEPGRGD